MHAVICMFDGDVSYMHACKYTQVCMYICIRTCNILNVCVVVAAATLQSMGTFLTCTSGTTVCAYVYLGVCMCVCVCGCVHVCMCIWVFACMVEWDIHTCTHTHTYNSRGEAQESQALLPWEDTKLIHVCVCVYIYIYIYIYICTYTCIVYDYVLNLCV